ncbi:MAG: hypothetical protein ICV73_11395 [Acetobacteraceae bacterium]|nr:hypothetical protein [Acetobacteraceae bacterium]
MRRPEATVRSQGALDGGEARQRNRPEPEAFARPEGIPPDVGGGGGAVSGTTVVLLAILASAVALVVLNRLEFLSVFPGWRRRPPSDGGGPPEGGGPPAR